jgi:hypothetical protein
MLNRIEPGVEKTLVRAGASLGHHLRFAVKLDLRRRNAIVRHGVVSCPARQRQRFEVHHPGDYDPHSNQSRYSTALDPGKSVAKTNC